MPLSKESLQELGNSLYECFEGGSDRAPLTDVYPEMSIEDAYRVQEVLVQRHLGGGKRLVGRKVGLTNKAIQAQVGIDQPDFGVLFDTHVFENRAVLGRKEQRMVLPRIEAELGFILDRDISGPGLTTYQIMAATRAVFPSFEIVDSRVRDWKIEIADTIADNSSSWGVVLGDRLASPLGLDLSTAGMVIEKDGEVLSTSAGAAVLGNPANAVAWLGNKLSEYGVPLKAGEYVMSGSFTAVVDAEPGKYRARFGDGIGTVEVEIKE